eukprot:TRINITY_DN1539_c0_g1_i1.p1 TRINITY_DN1539_c0_g1~~TRINITY_DN1539_c0_g1_i1.p1  ORF type:complete len:299 (+),score=31.58 TRINITY_DN1539_c0_g1_i1:146-1042(+)
MLRVLIQQNDSLREAIESEAREHRHRQLTLQLRMAETVAQDCLDLNHLHSSISYLSQRIESQKQLAGKQQSVLCDLKQASVAFDAELAGQFAPRLCSVCYEEFDAEHQFTITSCAHSVHYACLQTQAKCNLESSTIPVKCPIPRCGGALIEQDLLRLVDDVQMRLFYKLTMEQGIQCLPNVWRCKTVDCPCVVSLDDNVDSVTCPSCHVCYCLRCDVVYHENVTCDAFQQWRRDNAACEDNMEQLIVDGTVRRCQCGVMFQKNAGCEQVTCQCGAKVCWICGKVLTQRDPACPHAHYH